MEQPRWLATIIGALFVAFVLAAAGLATAASYDNDPAEIHAEDSDADSDADHAEDPAADSDADHTEDPESEDADADH